MQKDKFAREEAVTQLTPTKSSDNVKCGNYKAKYNELIKTPISPDDIPGLLTVQKKKRPNPSKPVRVTQVCGSMEGQNVLEKERKGREKENKRT